MAGDAGPARHGGWRCKRCSAILSVLQHEGVPIVVGMTKTHADVSLSPHTTDTDEGGAERRPVRGGYEAAVEQYAPAGVS
jgi:hypothetical protein